MDQQDVSIGATQIAGLKAVAQIAYLLYCLWVFIGIVEYVELVSSRVWMSSFYLVFQIILVAQLAATIVVLWKRGATCGSWLESHFQWLLYTFLFCSLGFLATLYMREFLVFTKLGHLVPKWGGLYVWMNMERLVIIALCLWGTYRAVKGWRKLYDNKPMTNCWAKARA
jgi:uncharacterized membrane protein